MGPSALRIPGIGRELGMLTAGGLETAPTGEPLEGRRQVEERSSVVTLRGIRAISTGCREGCAGRRRVAAGSLEEEDW